MIDHLSFVRILHELGSLLTRYETSWSTEIVPPQKLADILNLLQEKKLTSSSAKQLLAEVFQDKSATVEEIASSKGLLSSEIPDEEYLRVVRQVAEANQSLVEDILKKGKKGKIKGLVGMTLRELNKLGRSGSIRPERVQQFVEEELGKL
jgi:aspartyl-tRNA(Asn)/glutamyl-tRNA(Gln) amidotransferase subunit B